jgi:hypothetical protein
MRINLSKSESDLFSPFSAEVKNAWNCISMSPALLVVLRRQRSLFESVDKPWMQLLTWTKAIILLLGQNATLPFPGCTPPQTQPQTHTAVAAGKRERGKVAKV